jgi:hypothetical protein
MREKNVYVNYATFGRAIAPFPSTRKPSPIRMLARRRYEEACPGSGESAIQSRQNAGLSDERVNGLNNAG